VAASGPASLFFLAVTHSLLHALTHSHTHSPHSTIHSFPTPHQPSTNTAHTHTSFTTSPHHHSTPHLTHSLTHSLTFNCSVNSQPHSLPHSLNMAPRANAKDTSSTHEAVTQDNLEITKNLKLNDLRKALPAEVFDKSLPTSLFYLVFDVSVCLAALYVMHTAANSSVWDELSIVIKAAAWLLYWNVVGFFMWCLFVVGHDW
jgi:hypothetical protein